MRARWLADCAVMPRRAAASCWVIPRQQSWSSQPGWVRRSRSSRSRSSTASSSSDLGMRRLAPDGAVRLTALGPLHGIARRDERRSPARPHGRAEGRLHRADAEPDAPAPGAAQVERDLEGPPRAAASNCSSSPAVRSAAG